MKNEQRRKEILYALNDFIESNDYEIFFDKLLDIKSLWGKIFSEQYKNEDYTYRDSLEEIRLFLETASTQDIDTIRDACSSFSIEKEKIITQSVYDEWVSGKEVENRIGYDIKLKPTQYNREWLSVVDIANPEIMKNLVDADEKITELEKIKIRFNYPLSGSFFFEYENPNGFTRKEFCNAVLEGYNKIYNGENDAVGDPGNVEGLSNRAPSDGPYGIWGHYLGDLTLDECSDQRNGVFNLTILS